MEDDPVDLGGAEEAQQKKDELEKLARDIEIGDFKWLMSHKQGRRFVWRLLERYGVFRSVFDTDALVMSFREGQRNDGLRILLDIHEHTPERYIELLNERKNATRTQ